MYFTKQCHTANNIKATNQTISNFHMRFSPSSALLMPGYYGDKTLRVIFFPPDVHLPPVSFSFPLSVNDNDNLPPWLEYYLDINLFISSVAFSPSPSHPAWALIYAYRPYISRRLYITSVQIQKGLTTCHINV